MEVADPAAAVRRLRTLLGNVDFLYSTDNDNSWDANSEAYEQTKGVTYESVGGVGQIAKAAMGATFADTLTDALLRNDWSELRAGLRILIGEIEQAQEIARIVGPHGPLLAAERFHPWVWESAERLWSDGHRREAIQAAATQLDTELQAKLDRNDVDGKALADQAWVSKSLEPGRLEFVQYARGTKSWANAHEGARAFHQGCVLAIRNLLTHDTAQPSVEVGFEQLASLSVLARWIDVAEVTGP